MKELVNMVAEEDHRQSDEVDRTAKLEQPYGANEHPKRAGSEMAQTVLQGVKLGDSCSH